jgi:hypothetical protein
MTPSKSAPPAEWFRWAMDQFNLFDGAPRPSKDVVAWIPEFKTWLASGAGNRRKRTVAHCLLLCWNDSSTVPGAGHIWLEYGGMDPHNQAAVRRVLEHVRWF